MIGKGQQERQQKHPIVVSYQRSTHTVTSARYKQPRWARKTEQKGLSFSLTLLKPYTSCSTWLNCSILSTWRSRSVRIINRPRSEPIQLIVPKLGGSRVAWRRGRPQRPKSYTCTRKLKLPRQLGWPGREPSSASVAIGQVPSGTGDTQPGLHWPVDEHFVGVHICNNIIK